MGPLPKKDKHNFSPMVIWFLGSGPDRGRSPVKWGDFPYVCPYVCPSPPWAVQPGLRPSQPGRRPSQPGLKPSQPSLRPSQPGLRPSQQGLRPSQPGLRLSQSGLRSSQPGLRPSQLGLRLRQPARPEAQTASQTSGFRPGWLGLDGRTFVSTYVGKISPFYRTIRAAALLPKGRSRSIKRSRAREPPTI